MISSDVIEKILEAGVQAPSGGNSQPWRFEVANGVLLVIMIPEKDHAILNFKNRGTLLAHGALIENIVVAARYYGFEPDITFFPNKQNKNMTAEISFQDVAPGGEATLFDAIWKRTTNRKPFERRSIAEYDKTALLEIPAKLKISDVLLKLTEDRKAINVLAEAASANEAVMFEEKELHRLFFKELIWTEEDEKEKKSGLYLKTMELKPPQAMALKLFKSWAIMAFLNKFGAAKGIAGDNAKGYAECGLYGAVLCGDRDEDFLNAGRVIERAWLITTAAKLSFHLQTGVNFLWQGIVGGNGEIFSPEHVELIKKEYKIIEDVFYAGQGRMIPAIFRIGYDGAPSARSSKKAPEVIIR